MPEITTDLGVFVKDSVQKVMVSSRDVARVFEKDHKNIIRDVKNLECSEEFNALNFEPVEYRDAKGEKRPEYLMTRDGFTILAMGFTGKKAMQFKEAYIKAFNAMESALWEEGVIEAGNNRPAVVLDFKTAKYAIAGVTAFRDVMPQGMRRRIMARYYEMIGVPDVVEDDSLPGETSVEKFCNECVCRQEGARCTRDHFYGEYLRWCAQHDETPISRCSAMRFMNRMGSYANRKSGRDRYWEGLGITL